MIKTSRRTRSSRNTGRDVRRRRGGSAGKPLGGRSKVRFVGTVIILCAVVSTMVAVEHVSNVGKIQRGVSVGDVALGGKTPEEARRVLKERVPESQERIEFSAPGGSFALSAEDLGVRLDVGATVERAYAVGRQGSVPERLAQRVRSFVGVSVPAEVGYRPAAARAAARRIAFQASHKARDASVSVSGSNVNVTGSAQGYRLDAPAALLGLNRALESLSDEVKLKGEVLEPEVTTRDAEEAAEDARNAISSPLVLKTQGRSWSLSPESVGSALYFSKKDGELRAVLNRGLLKGRMADIYADIEVESVDAGYDDVGGGATPKIAVTPSREGRRIEEEELFGAMEKDLFRGRHEYEVPVATERPDLTAAEAERMKPTQVLGSYRTNYAVVPDTGERVENLGISSKAVNGTLLAPGEVFSMNAHVSHLDYNESKVIVGGQETNADGGGLCQVTSTLYNAANFAGLDVIERTPHSAQLPYIRPGMDATVWWGGPGKADDLDMKFRNTTDGYLLLREYVAEDGYVYAEIWGRPDGTDVKMRSEPTYLDKDGSEWITYQTVEKNGRVVFDGVLHKDSYEPLVDEKGDPIPPPDVPVAPVAP